MSYSTLLLWSSRFLSALPVLALVALVCVLILAGRSWQECRRAHADKVHRDWERWHAQHDAPRDGGNLSTRPGTEKRIRHYRDGREVDENGREPLWKKPR